MTGRVEAFLLTSASDGIVTLLSIVVTTLVICMIGVIVMLVIGSKKQKKRGHTGLLADVPGERYGAAGVSGRTAAFRNHFPSEAVPQRVS